MRRSAVLLWVVGVGLGLGSLSAEAAPVTYNFSSGSATLSATNTDTNNVVLAPVTIAMDGLSVTFDEATIDLTDLWLTFPQTLIFDLEEYYGGYNQFRAESASITPGAFYATLDGQDQGGGSYTFLAGPLDIEGVWSSYDTAYDGINGTPPAENQVVPFEDDSLIVGSINVGTGFLELTGITLALLDGANFGEAGDLEIKADIMFTGSPAPVVPEPGTASLLALGLLGLAARRRSRS